MTYVIITFMEVSNVKCEVCGSELREVVWFEEAWGVPQRCVDYDDCKNPNCGEEEE
jgi:hypothetical protein